MSFSTKFGLFGLAAMLLVFGGAAANKAGYFDPDQVQLASPAQAGDRGGNYDNDKPRGEYKPGDNGPHHKPPPYGGGGKPPHHDGGKPHKPPHHDDGCKHGKDCGHEEPPPPPPPPPSGGGTGPTPGPECMTCTYAFQTARAYWKTYHPDGTDADFMEEVKVHYQQRGVWHAMFWQTIPCSYVKEILQAYQPDWDGNFCHVEPIYTPVPPVVISPRG